MSKSKITKRKRTPLKSRKSKKLDALKSARATNKRKQLNISNRRLERALKLIADGYGLPDAARSIRVTPDRLKKIAVKNKLIRKSGDKWIVAGRLSRRMIMFSDGRVLIVTTRSKKSASLVGRYMASVRQFLRTNDPKVLSEFAGSHIKDTTGKIHPFEIDPNALYQIASAGGEHFEEIYRIVI